MRYMGSLLVPLTMGWMLRSLLYNKYREHTERGTYGQGYLDPWIHGSMDAWIHGSMDPWIHGSMGPWVHGSMDTMDPWIHGSMYPRLHGSMHSVY